MQQRIRDVRVEHMFATDRLWALGSLVVLWCTYVFVFIEICLSVNHHEAVPILAVAGGLVLLFNTASIIVMIAHYSADKERIYGLDIHYLDEMKKARG